MTPTHLVRVGLDTESWLGPHGKRGRLDRVLLGELAVDSELVQVFQAN